MQSFLGGKGMIGSAGERTIFPPKPLRGPRQTMQRVIPIESPFFIPREKIHSPSAWREIFGNDNPVSLEIGCGVGDFIAAMAAEHPDHNFIAIDIYNQGCLKSCKRIERMGLSNVRVLRVEARYLLEEMIPPSFLAQVFINCPDPWPKRRHRKRRLVQPAFVDLLESRLAPGGVFTFATDFSDYGKDVAMFMQGRGGMENLLAPDPYRHHLDGYPLTKYMLKFMAEGSRIYFVRYRKRG